MSFDHIYEIFSMIASAAAVHYARRGPRTPRKRGRHRKR